MQGLRYGLSTRFTPAGGGIMGKAAMFGGSLALMAGETMVRNYFRP